MIPTLFKITNCPKDDKIQISIRQVAIAPAGWHRHATRSVSPTGKLERLLFVDSRKASNEASPASLRRKQLQEPLTLEEQICDLQIFVSNVHTEPDRFNSELKVKHTKASNSLKTAFWFKNRILDTKYAHDVVLDPTQVVGGCRFSVFMSVWSLRGCKLQV